MRLEVRLLFSMSSCAGNFWCTLISGTVSDMGGGLEVEISEFSGCGDEIDIFGGTKRARESTGLLLVVPGEYIPCSFARDFDRAQHKQGSTSRCRVYSREQIDARIDLDK